MSPGRGRPRIGDKIEVRLPPAALERLDAEAERRGVFRAELVRDIVEAFVASLPGRRRRRTTTTTTTKGTTT